jgi:hypothetical protein
VTREPESNCRIDRSFRSSVLEANDYQQPSLAMRFRTSVRNIGTLAKIAASLGSLGKVAWLRLEEDHVRFTIIPDSGTQVWAVLTIVRA